MGNQFTVKFVEALEIPGSGQKTYTDAKEAGFCVRVSYRGTKTYSVVCRVKGDPKKRRTTIGVAGEISLADARERAQEIKKCARQGIDLVEEERRETRHESDMFEAVCELFIERYAKNKQKKSWKETRGIFHKWVLPEWRGRAIGSIDRRDVVELLDWIEDQSGPYRASQVFTHVRKLFNWARDERAIIETTPLNSKMSRGKPPARERVLSDDELKIIWAATEKTGHPYGAFDKILILTGQRKGEVAGMRWEAIDIEKRIWTLEGEETKAARRHEVPLSDMAIEIISSIPCTGKYVFTSGRIGDNPINGWSKSKIIIDRESGVTNWRRHDYRRTVATNISLLHFPRFVIERVLNHADNSVTAIYDRGTYIDEKREALDAWAAKLQSIIDPPDDTNVVEWDRSAANG